MRRQIQINANIQKDYQNRIYGYKMTDYKSITELNILYDQICILKSNKVKEAMFRAITARAIELSKPQVKRQIKNILKEKLK